jgi:hypothetical protein
MRSAVSLIVLVYLSLCVISWKWAKGPERNCIVVCCVGGRLTRLNSKCFQDISEFGESHASADLGTLGAGMREELLRLTVILISTSTQQRCGSPG